MVDLSWVTPTLAVGARFDGEDHEALAHTHGVRAIVDLREEACDDVTALATHGIAHLHLPTPDHGGVSLDMLHRGVAFADHHLAHDRRVLIHCAYGIGRSALLALCVLVHHGHAPLAALALAKDRRACVSPSQAQFEAWLVWLATRAEGAAWQLPTFDEFCAIAYRHLRH